MSELCTRGQKREKAEEGLVGCFLCFLPVRKEETVEMGNGCLLVKREIYLFVECSAVEDEPQLKEEDISRGLGGQFLRWHAQVVF